VTHQLLKEKRLIVCIAVLLIAIGGWSVWHVLDKPIISQRYISQVNFPVYAAKSASGLVFRQSSINVSNPEDGTTLIKFNFVGKNNTITLTEQAYPQIIIPDQFFAGINEYNNVSSSLGNIVLARPGNAQTGHQIAVAIPNNATMIFANPEHQLSAGQWQQFFNALSVSR
jgi:hypothetical protein